jgi:hypothetical protein
LKRLEKTAVKLISQRMIFVSACVMIIAPFFGASRRFDELDDFAAQCVAHSLGRIVTHHLKFQTRKQW